jgi:hypothetical protein
MILCLHLSIMLTSTVSPSVRPLSCFARRARRAIAVPNAAVNPATESPRLMFGRTGGPLSSPVFSSGKPFMNRKPASPSHTLAYPGREDQGPVWPYPETRVKISPGLAVRSVSGPRPHFSSAV